MGLLNKKFEASEKNKAEHLRHYEDAINDKTKLVDEYTCRITNLQSQCSSFEERCSSLLKAVESATRESLEWKRKYEQISSKQKAEKDNTSAEIVVLQSRISATNARLAAAREQVQSAEEATEWKRKFDIAARETKAAMEKAVTVQECASKQTQLREDVLRAEFSSSLVGKDEEIKDKVVKIENVEQRLTTAVLELKAAKSKMRSYDLELSAQKFEIKELVEKLDAVEVASQSFEREAKIQEQEKTHLEQKYLSKFKGFEEAQERYKNAEKDAKRATELADKARAEAVAAQKEKNDVQRVAMERLTQIERTERQFKAWRDRKLIL